MTTRHRAFAAILAALAVCRLCSAACHAASAKPESHRRGWTRSSAASRRNWFSWAAVSIPDPRITPLPQSMRTPRAASSPAVSSCWSVDTSSTAGYGDTLSWSIGDGPGLGERPVQVILSTHSHSAAWLDDARRCAYLERLREHVEQAVSGYRRWRGEPFHLDGADGARCAQRRPLRLFSLCAR
jgi:hypothetical protein